MDLPPYGKTFQKVLLWFVPLELSCIDLWNKIQVLITLSFSLFFSFPFIIIITIFFLSISGSQYLQSKHHQSEKVTNNSCYSNTAYVQLSNFAYAYLHLTYKETVCDGNGEKFLYCLTFLVTIIIQNFLPCKPHKFWRVLVSMKYRLLFYDGYYVETYTCEQIYF